MMGEVVAINGKIFKPSEAKISVFDRGFLYGDSVYEVCRSYDGVFFGLEDHIDRLFRSGQRITLDMQMHEREYMAEIYRVAHESGINNAYMRIIVTRGNGESDITLDPMAVKGSTSIIMIKKISTTMLNPKYYDEGIDVITAQTVRNPKRSLDPNIKSGNYLNSILALAEAKKAGANDAIMLNLDGFVTEGTTSNVYFVKGGTVYTAPDDCEILQGITRAKIKKICKENKIRFVEKLFRPEDIYKADEAFVSGSVKEITPVRTLDGETIGDELPGPVTQNLMGLYTAKVKEYCDTFRARVQS